MNQRLLFCDDIDPVPAVSALAELTCPVLERIESSPPEIQRQPQQQPARPPGKWRLKVERRHDGWWVDGLPANDVTSCGPYTIRSEAEDAKRGLLNFYEANPSYAV